MKDFNLTPNESIQLRAVLSEEANITKKLQSNMGMIKDAELKTFSQKSIDTKKRHIKDFQNFAQNDLGLM